MTDLLERVRALNPVPTCAEPSIDDVWRKLEHNQPTSQDDTSTVSSARVAQRPEARRLQSPDRKRAGRRSGFSRIGLAIAIAVPVLVAVVALVILGHRSGTTSNPATNPHEALLSPSQRLADGTISCYFGTSGPLHPSGAIYPDAGPNPATGQSPIAYCRRRYALNAHTGLNAAHLRFVACQSSPTNVAVYIADGKPGQCRRLGHRPLPDGYPAAQHELASLGQALVAIQNQHDCVTPVALAAEVRSALVNLGFADWGIRLPTHTNPQWAPPAGTGGICGQVVSNPPASAPQFNAPSRQVFMSTGPPGHIARFITKTSGQLWQRSYRQCFTAASIRALARHAFASLRMQPRFATTTANGSQYKPGSQRLYNAGCVRFYDALPANDNNYVDVVLVARTGTPLQKGWIPQTPPVPALNTPSAKPCSWEITKPTIRRSHGAVQGVTARLPESLNSRHVAARSVAVEHFCFSGTAYQRSSRADTPASATEQQRRAAGPGPRGVLGFARQRKQRLPA